MTDFDKKSVGFESFDSDDASDDIDPYDLLEADPEPVPRIVIPPKPVSTERLCPECGYDMRGLSHDICPECGEEHAGIEATISAHESSIWHWFVPLRWIPICVLPMLLIWAPLAWLAMAVSPVVGRILAMSTGLIAALGLSVFATIQAYSEEDDFEGVVLAVAIFFVVASLNFGALGVLL